MHTILTKDIIYASRGTSHHIKVSQENSELSSNHKNIVLYIMY